MLKNIFSKSNKRKAIIVSSISPQNIPSIDIKTFFIETEIDHLDYLDVIDFIDNCYSFSEAVTKFNSWIQDKYNDYDIFLGFAFGGVLLQHALNLLPNKKIILVSSPGRMEGNLQLKLSSLVDLLNKGKLLDALYKLHEFVKYDQAKSNMDECLICYPLEQHTIKRLLKGFNMILDMEIATYTSSSNVINIVGNKSNLVTNYDVNPSFGKTFKIPNAGMRVLEHNPNAVKDVINNFILEPIV